MQTAIGCSGRRIQVRLSEQALSLIARIILIPVVSPDTELGTRCEVE